MNKKQLFQQILKEKWYIGSNVHIFSDCAFCQDKKSRGLHCEDCQVADICIYKLGKIGKIYQEIVYSEFMIISDLPINLLKDFIAAIEEEINS